MEKLKTQDILVLALAVVTVVVCLVVLIPNFSQRNDMAAIATPEPTVEPQTEPEATPEPTPEPTPELTPEPNIHEEYSRAMMESMSTEDKVWQLFLATPESITGVDVVTISGDGMQSALESYPVGGLVYSSRNIEDEQQLSDMLAGAQSRAATALFIAYDSNAGSAPITLDGSMSALGFNLGLANGESGLLCAASYSDDLSLDGIAAVIAPSYDVESAETESDESESKEADTLPFYLSADSVRALRADWDGLVLTPLLTDGVEGYSDGELAVAALQAGCDMICALNDPISAGQAVIDAINNGELSLERVNEAVQRILFAKLESGILSVPESESTTETESLTETESVTESETPTEAQSDDAQGTRE